MQTCALFVQPNLVPVHLEVATKKRDSCVQQVFVSGFAVHVLSIHRLLTQWPTRLARDS